MTGGGTRANNLVATTLVGDDAVDVLSRDDAWRPSAPPSRRWSRATTDIVIYSVAPVDARMIMNDTPTIDEC